MITNETIRLTLPRHRITRFNNPTKRPVIVYRNQEDRIGLILRIGLSKYFLNEIDVLTAQNQSSLVQSGFQKWGNQPREFR